MDAEAEKDTANHANRNARVKSATSLAAPARSGIYTAINSTAQVPVFLLFNHMSQMCVRVFLFFHKTQSLTLLLKIVQNSFFSISDYTQKLVLHFHRLI